MLILTAPPAALTTTFNINDELVFANTGFDLGIDPHLTAASLYFIS